MIINAVLWLALKLPVLIEELFHLTTMNGSIVEHKFHFNFGLYICFCISQVFLEYQLQRIKNTERKEALAQTLVWADIVLIVAATPVAISYAFTTHKDVLQIIGELALLTCFLIHKTAHNKIAEQLALEKDGRRRRTLIMLSKYIYCRVVKMLARYRNGKARRRVDALSMQGNVVPRKVAPGRKKAGHDGHNRPNEKTPAKLGAAQKRKVVPGKQKAGKRPISKNVKIDYKIVRDNQENGNELN